MLSASSESVVEDTSRIPFFNAISSTSLTKIIKEIADVNISFEDYQ